jgi:enamine deaminase RidA (YjgF/YER057c/UK114 family)
MKEIYKGYEINIERDESGSDFDPRGNDNLCTMICFHRRYRLGDNTKLNSNDFNGWADLKKYLEKENDIAIIKPLYLYDHSGITISTSPFSCRWDSGQVGFVYVRKKNIRENFGIKKITKEYLERAEKVLEAEIKEYDNYIRGNVFRYDITDENDNHVDSCCGFICDSEEDVWEEMLGEIKSIIDYNIKEKQEKLDNKRFLMYSFDVLG